MLVDLLPFKMIKTELNGSAYDFSVNSNIIDSSNIIDIHVFVQKEYHSIKCLDLLCLFGF